MAQFLANEMFAIPGRTAVITGGGSGLGRMIAKSFFVNGASVTLVDQFQERLHNVKTELEAIRDKLKLLGKIETVEADLSTKDGISAAVDKIRSVNNEVDVLVTAAGIRLLNSKSFIPGQSLATLVEATQSLSYDDLDKSFRINLYHQYFLAAGLLDLIGAAAKNGGGRGSIIMLSSVASKHNGQFVPAYQLTKAAVDHLVKIMAAEFADYYIRVNAISPGLFISNMNPSDPSHPDSNMKFASEMPARRAGTEQEMAATALYLASSAGAYMNGNNMHVDGGRLLVAAGKISSKL